jgi:recombination protein U
MVGYPNKRPDFKKQKQSQASRGMKFESMINESNEYYRLHDIAIIYKKPIPIQIVKVDYPSRSGAVIKEAYYKIPSTTDYNGIYKGKYIDFEAKETRNKTSFPLNNIHKHQVQHLLDVQRHGGVAFILIYAIALDEIYLLKAKDLEFFYHRSLIGRKSISFLELKERGIKIHEYLSPRIDYLKAVDLL